MKRLRKILLVAAPAVVATAIVGAIAVSARADYVPPTEFIKNDSGQTIGEYKAGGPRPDLIPAVTSDGDPGYIYLNDLLWDEPKNPEEAIELMKEKINDTGDIVVSVYAADGKTKIGEFIAAHVSEEPAK
jgi:hypothetical protein